MYIYDIYNLAITYCVVSKSIKLACLPTALTCATHQTSSGSWRDVTHGTLESILSLLFQFVPPCIRHWHCSKNVPVLG